VSSLVAGRAVPRGGTGRAGARRDVRGQGEGGVNGARQSGPNVARGASDADVSGVPETVRLATCDRRRGRVGDGDVGARCRGSRPVADGDANDVRGRLPRGTESQEHRRLGSGSRSEVSAPGEGEGSALDVEGTAGVELHVGAAARVGFDGAVPPKVGKQWELFRKPG